MHNKLFAVLNLAIASYLSAQTTVTLVDLENNSTAYDTTGDDTTFSIAGGTATQSGSVSGTGSVIKTGGGTVEFTAFNSYTGSTDVQEGTLTFSKPAFDFAEISQTSGISVGDSATASLNIRDGVLIFNTGAITLGNTGSGHGTLSISNSLAPIVGSLSNNGDLIVGNAGTGILNLTSGGGASVSGSLRLGAASGGIGNVVVDASGITVSQNILIGEGADSTGSFTITNGGSVSVDNILIAVSPGSSGQLNILNGGTLWIDNPSSGDAIQAGAGSATVTIDGGQLRTNERSSSVSAPITISGTATFDAGRTITLHGEISGTGTLLKTGVDPLVLTADNTYTGGTTVSAGWLTLGAGGTSGSVTGNITNNAIVEYNRSDDHSYTGVISGTGAVDKRGTNNLTLTADHTYSGGTKVWAGTLTLGTGGTTGSVVGDIDNRGTVVFNRSGDHTYNGVISGTGSVVHDGNILRLTSAQTYTGPTVLNSGYFVLPTDIDQALSASTSLNIAFGATLDISNRALEVAGLSGAGQVYSFGGSAGELTVNTAAGPAQNFSGSLGSTYPNFSLLKSGAGTLILSGANTHTGSTTVNAGTLLVNGSTASASAVTVNADGTLGGTGTLGGAVTVAGTLSPGQSPGTLDFLNDLTLESNASLIMEITGTGGGEYDILNGDGSHGLTLDGILQLDNTGYTPILGDSVALFTNWNSIAGTFTSISGADLGNGLTWDTGALYTTGTLTVIPEPSSLMFIIFATGLGLLAFTRPKNG